MTDIPDAAMAAAEDAYGSAWVRCREGDNDIYPLAEALRAALPHLVPRELLIEAAEIVQGEGVIREYHGSYSQTEADQCYAIALRLRRAAGE